MSSERRQSPKCLATGKTRRYRHWDSAPLGRPDRSGGTFDHSSVGSGGTKAALHYTRRSHKDSHQDGGLRSAPPIKLLIFFFQFLRPGCAASRASLIRKCFKCERSKSPNADRASKFFISTWWPSITTRPSSRS